MLIKANYIKLDAKCLTDNRKFWKAVKPLFPEKIKVSPKINLLENEVLVTGDRSSRYIYAIKKYSSHPSIELIYKNEKIIE